MSQIFKYRIWIFGFIIKRIETNLSAVIRNFCGNENIDTMEIYCLEFS